LPAAAAPRSSAAPSPSLTSAPIPSVAQLTAAYKQAATEVNEANHAARASWDRSAQTLADAKRLARAYAAADLAFIRAVQAIPWYGDYKTLARRVLTPDNRRYVAHGRAMASTTWADYDVYQHEADSANMDASAASNELRIALGLPPVPCSGVEGAERPRSAVGAEVGRRSATDPCGAYWTVYFRLVDQALVAHVVVARARARTVHEPA